MPKTMTPLERLKRTLNFQETDEVVTGEIIQNGRLINHFAEREVHNDWTMEEIAATYRELKIDVGMLIAPAGKPHIETRYGLTYEVTFWSEWVIERPFNDVRGAQDFLKKLIIDVGKSDSHTIWSYAGPGGIVGQDVDNYAAYFQKLKGEVHPTVPCHIESPIGLDVIYNMVGWELFSYLLADDPELVSEAFEVLNRHEEKRVHLVADPEISPLVIVYCDIASKKDVIMSPAYLRREFFPRLKRLVNAWHEHGVKVIFHSEGNIKKVMDDLVACEVDGINPLEPENISLAYAREYYPKLVLWGGIDDKQLLPFGTTEQVEEAVKNAIDACSDGGLILGSSGEMHPEVKPQNAIMLFKTAKRYGRE